MKKKITPWEQLNLAIKAYEAMKRRDEGGSVRFCGATCGIIEVYSGLKLLADAACQTVRTYNSTYDDPLFSSEFIYRNITFLQDGESAEESYGVR